MYPDADSDAVSLPNVNLIEGDHGVDIASLRLLGLEVTLTELTDPGTSGRVIGAAWSGHDELGRWWDSSRNVPI